MSVLQQVVPLLVAATLLGACSDNTSPGDTTPPSPPTGVLATATSASQIDLSWTASTDNVGVAGYTIFRSGVPVGTASTNSFSHTGLTASTTYSYTVSAHDAAGNISVMSASASATTPAQPGNTITAASCARGAVQSAVDAAPDGYTVVVPAGSCSWDTPVRFSNTSGLTLRCSTVGACGITAQSQAILFDALSGLNTHFYRISGFNFSNAGASFLIWFDGNGTMTQLRVDHNTFSNLGEGSFAVFFGDTQGIGNYYGVIDHNTLTTPSSSSLLHYIGAVDQTPPLSPLGTANNLFVEDNAISIATMTNAGSGCMDSWGGAAVVWRYNTSTNCLVTTHGVVHAGGPQNIELYDNNIGVNGGAVAAGLGDCYRCFHHQGSGEFIAFNNRFTGFNGKSGDPLEMTHYRSATPAAAGFSATLGRCDGTQAIDGNRAPASTYHGYPCWRQPGRDFAGNLMPMYIWNNKWLDTGARIDMAVENPWGATNPAVSDHIKADRDYYNAVSAAAQASPTSPFKGTTGMGFGTLANRPPTCTTNALESGGGVGYFATDQGAQGTLYRCSATNTWTAWYTPFTYPHPLVAGA